MAQTLDPDRQAGGVHEGEHLAHAVVGLAHQVALGVLEAHHAGRRPLDTHLVLNPDAGAVRLGLQAPVVLDLVLGDQEQGDTLGAGGGIRKAGQHEVDDVAGPLVVPAADEDLGAGDLVGLAVARGLCGALHHPEVRARLGLRQAHGAGPLPRGHLGQEPVLELLDTVGKQALHSTVGEHGVHVPRPVGRGAELLLHCIDGQWEALATVLLGSRQGRPARLAIRLVRLVPLGRGVDLGWAPLAALISNLIDGVQGILGKLGHLLDDDLDSVLGHGVREGLPDVDDLIEDELHVPDGRLVGHAPHGTRASDPRHIAQRGQHFVRQGSRTK
eukprot:RCo012486